MINHIVSFFRDLYLRIRFNGVERVLMELTSCRDLTSVRLTTPNVTLQIRNPAKKAPGIYQPLIKYLTLNYPMLPPLDLANVGVMFGELPSLCPKEERFANMYFVYNGAVFDSGLVACVFAGDKIVSLVYRMEVIYSAGWIKSNIPIEEELA